MLYGKRKYKLFSKLDIRVGKIVTAEEFKEAIKPAYILTIDFGFDIGIKKTSAQVTNYSLKELENKKCVAIINLGDKQIGPICLSPRFITAIQLLFKSFFNV